MTSSRLILGWLSILGFHLELAAAAPLTIASDFEGASVRVIAIDSRERSISVTPGGDPSRGWPCWWYFRIDGISPGETITLRVGGSTAAVGKPGLPMQKAISASWATPHQATYSTDGKNWIHTEKGVRQNGGVVYQIKVEATSAFVAWGPPYTPAEAGKLVREIAKRHDSATAVELCRSREDRPVPMLHVQEGEMPSAERFGVWVQARQHAWESGSSWVAQGFVEWIVGDSAEATWLRQHAEVFVVPIMDVDNTATGNGGKDAQPHDHNRDWSAEPKWNEVRAAQKRIGKLIAEGRMDVFLDLHNPAPGDPTFFYVLEAKLLKEPMIKLRDRFVELAYGRISKIKPMIPMSNRPKVTGANYHPLWRQMSGSWVSLNGNPHTVALCLETIWNAPNSTTAGYRAVGSSLGATVHDFLRARPEILK